MMIKAFQKADIPFPLPIMKSGEEAIAYLSESAPFENSAGRDTPTLILLDLELPGKSGFDVLEWIRQHPKFQQLPVVMLTSSSNPKHVDRAYELGANSYLLKPTSLKALVEMVSALKKFWGTSNLSSEFP